MAVAERFQDRINLTTEYRETELVKSIPGARWDRYNRVWHIRLSWAACVQARATFGNSLVIGQELAQWARNEIGSRIEPCLQLRTQDDIELTVDLPAWLMSQLFPFQRVGALFLATAGQALLGDECGTGKTVQTLAAIEALGAYPALVVTPNSVKPDWLLEVKKWLPDRRALILEGIVTKRRKQIAAVQAGEADILIANWESLSGHSRLAPYGYIELSDKDKTPGELNGVDWIAVASDEVHRAKDPKAKQTRALWAVGHQDSVRYRYGLTGTPIAASPQDLWSIMHFIVPNEYPTKTGYTDRYCIAQQNRFGFTDIVGLKAETREELYRILDPRFIRRLKKNVLPQLPEKVYLTRHVDMGTKQKKAYEQIRKQKLAELDGGVLLTLNPLTEATRMLQFASAYGEIGEPAFEVREEGKRVGLYASQEEAYAHASQLPNGVVNDMTPLILTEPSTKVDELVALLEELGDQPALVFAESRQLLEIAERRLTEKTNIRSALFTGTTTDDEKERAKTRFKAGDIRVLLLTFGAGGEGLTLTTAANVIFLQRSFREIKNQQAEDRVHRPGQTADKVAIYDIITRDTIESKVHAQRIVNQAMAEEVTRDLDLSDLRSWFS